MSGPVNGHGDIVPQGSVPSMKCTAHTTAGNQCKKWAIVGGNVCDTHGGSAPQVRAAAQRRIVGQVLPNLALAQRIIDDPETPAPVRARLLIDWFDRAGLKAPEVHAHLGVATVATDLDASIEQALRARGMWAPALEGPTEDDLLEIEGEEDEDLEPVDRLEMYGD